MPARFKRYLKGEYIYVANPAKLSAALKTHVESHFKGRVKLAAKAARIPESTFRRVMAGNALRYRVAVIALLDEFLNLGDLWAIIFTPRQRLAFKRYRAWIEKETTRTRSEAGTDQDVGVLAGPALESKFASQRELLLAWLIEKLPTVHNAMLKEARVHGDERLAMSFDRMIAPLLEARRSGFVERLWRELSERELRVFLTAGWQCEHILLNRQPDIVRVQRQDASRRVAALTGLPFTKLPKPKRTK